MRAASRTGLDATASWQTLQILADRPGWTLLETAARYEPESGGLVGSGVPVASARAQLGDHFVQTVASIQGQQHRLELGVKGQLHAPLGELLPAQPHLVRSGP